MRQLLHLALCAWPADVQAEEAIAECSRLAAAVAVCLLRGRGSLVRAATAIADMELVCARLRLVVGEDLVDLEKAAALARLQRRLLAIAREPEIVDSVAPELP